MKIWLDDIRPAPEGWVWCKTAEVVIERLMTTPSLIVVCPYAEYGGKGQDCGLLPHS